MKKDRIVLQKIIAIFLVFVMLLGVAFPNSLVLAEREQVGATVTSEKVSQEKETGKGALTDVSKVEDLDDGDKKDLSENTSEQEDKNIEKSKEPSAKRTKRSLSLDKGTPMGNGKLLVYDDSHKIEDASNGDGISVNKYNLATMTKTLFTINYTPFFHVKDDGSNDYGDQRIVVDIPSYGFKLSNPGIEGTQFGKITMLDANGKVIPLDSVSQKNYEKVVKIIYDVNDSFLGSLGGGSSLVFNIAFDRRSLTDQECKKWIDEGKLETSLNVAACEGEDNTPINSTGNPSVYKWKMSPINYEDTKTTVTGDRHLNASSLANITNTGFVSFYDADPTSGPFTGNRDYYYYT